MKPVCDCFCIATIVIAWSVAVEPLLASDIQMQIQELISQGVSIRNVAKTLHMAKGTVQKYRK
jgi:DNA-binding NarL/FixJ family response regulator